MFYLIIEWLDFQININIQLLKIYNPKYRGCNTYLDEVTDEAYRKAFSYPTIKKL